MVADNVFNAGTNKYAQVVVSRCCAGIVREGDKNTCLATQEYGCLFHEKKSRRFRPSRAEPAGLMEISSR